MIRFPEVRALARTIAAVVLSVAALGALPAAAATITISDTAFSGNQTVCPRDNAALATPIPVNAFQVSADADSTLSRIRVQLLPAGSYANLERVEIRSADLVTLYGGVIPSGDDFWVNLATPLPASATPASFRIAIVPRRYADMPPAASGKSYAIQARLFSALSTGNSVVGNDLVSATVTVDNSVPANVTWSGVTSGAAIAMNWSTAANVVVMRREAAPIFDAAVAGTTYLANTTVGSSRVLFVGSAASYSDASVQPNRTYYYKVFTRAPSCVTYSTGAALGPIIAGGTAEGDATNDTTKPVIGIVSPGPGPVTRPFKVKIRVFSPSSLPITEVRLYGNTGGTETLLGSSIGAGALITRNANYDGGAPADPASGFYEFTATGGFAAGDTTLRAWARNVASTALTDGVYSTPLGVSVGTSLGDGKLLVRDNSSQLCADCHKEQTHSAETVGTGHGSWYVACRGCHDPHGTTNAKLIAKEVTPPAYAGIQTPQQIFYTGATGNVAGGKVNPTGTGLCQACHTRTSVFVRGDTTDQSAHDGGQPCANCHKHDKGLGASCSSCHGLPTRNIAGGDSMQAAAPPRGAPPAYATTGNAVGMHLAHVTGTSFRSEAIRCGSCHVMPNAHNGTVDAPTFPFIYPPAPGTPVATSGTWNAGSSTCSATWCHAGPATRSFAGTNRNPNWLTSPGLTCQSCHASPPVGAALYAHTSPTDTNCAPCHGAGYALAGITGTARDTHINGNLEATGCTGCHGGANPAGNAAPPDPATASPNAIGAHQAHVVNTNFTTSALACSECHPMPAGSHPEGSVVVTLGSQATNGGTMPATYFGLSNPSNPTCSSVYCHAGAAGGSTAAPNWTTGTAMNCASCHGNPPGHPHPGNTTCLSCHPSSGSETYSRTSPTTGTVVKATHIANGVNRTTAACTSCHGTLTASGVTLVSNTVQSAPGYDTTGSVDTFGGSTSASPGVGAHRTHLTATRIRPGGAAVCSDCHVLPPAETDTSHAQDPGTGGARAAVRFLSLGGLTGTYSGSTSGGNGATAGNCSANYCHGGKFTTAPYQGSTPAPNWSSGTAMNCGSCHLFPPTTHTFVSTTTQCGSCHTGWTTCTTGNQATCVAPATHVDPLAPPATTNCTSCHGTPGAGGNAAPPVAAIKTPAVGPNAIGAHQSHLTTAPSIANSLTCDDCHIPVTQLTSANHNNGTVNTQFTTARSTGTGWSGGAAGTSNCSSSWCHGGAATQAQWGRAQPNPLWNDATDSFKACNACHGNPPPLNAATHHPPNSVTACTVCHGNGYGATITGAALGTHIDPSRTINFRAGCTGCHGDVTQTGVLRTSNASAPGFNANAIDISGSPTGTRVGAHAAHLNGTRLRTTTLACSECHPVPADGDLTHADGAGNSTGARANAGMPGTLANGTILGGANTNPSYSSPNCSSVYCHGATYVGRTGYSGTNSGSPAWTQTTAVAAGCGTCHAAPPAGGTHDGARAGTANCGPCHTGYDACNISNLATCSLPGVHINGQFDPVSGGCSMCHGAPPTTMTASPAPFAGATHPQNSTCTACHGAGYTQPFTVTPSTHPSSGNVTTPGTDAPRNGCTACHGVLAGPTAAAVTVNTTVSIAPGYNGVGVDSTGSTNTNDRGVGAHDAHVRKTNLRAAALACTECHTRSLPASGDAAHSNGVVPTLEFGGLGTTGGITNAQFTGTGCSMTYCHGNFTNGKDQLAGGTPTTPGQVTGVSSPTQTNRSITLNWTAVTGAVLYKIERSDTVIGGPYVQIGTSSTNSYVDDGLWDGRTYYYRVRAWNTATVGDGAYSSPSLTQATTSSGGTPTTSTYNWHYARTGSMNGLTYNWPNTACGTYVTVTNTTQTIAPMETTVDATCAADRLYNSGSGPFYALTLVSPAYAQATVISAPSYAISLRNGTTTTNITWGFQLGYVLSGAYTMWGTEVTAAVGGTQTTVNPNLSGQTGTIPQNASLVLRIRKITATTDVARTYVGGTSSVLTVTETPSGTAPTLPAVPTGVAANFRVTGTTQDTVSLAWDPVANTSTYHVERSATAGGPTWTQIAEVAATSVTDRALTASSRYYYRVIASNPAGNSTGGYTTAAVFGDTSAAAPAGQVSWTGTFSTVATTTSLTCTSCHGNPPLGTHPTNANACSTCHGTGYSDNTVSPQLVDKALHMNGVFNVDCVGCHATAQGNRREVVSEFDGAWSHKRSETGTTKVNKWDCIVCHMEGDPATGERVTGVHGNGLINLRDPDSGNNIKTVTFSSALAGNAAGAYAETTTDATFAAFGRELGIRFEAENATSLAALQAQMVSFCLKCHDSNGATAFASGALAAMPSTTGAARSAGRPFGTSVGPIASYPGGTGLTACATSGDNGCVTDVKSSFATSNASYHPVLGRNNNSYVGSGRMRAPYNNAFTRTPPTTTVYGNLLSCWDCHAPNGTSGPQRASVTAHGGGSTLRAAVWVNNATNLCNVCHNTGASGNNHGTGSAFGSGGNSGLGTYLTQQCNVCHGSQYAVGGAARPIRGQDVHGFDKFANNMGTDTFWPVGANAQKCTAAGVPWACCTGAAAGATCTETNSGYKPYAFMRNVGTGGAWPAAVNAWKPLSGGTSPNTVPTGTATCGGSGTLNGTSACGNRTHGTYTPGGAY